MNDLAGISISQIIEDVKKSDFTELRMAYRGLELWITRRKGGFDVRTTQTWSESTDSQEDASTPPPVALRAGNTRSRPEAGAPVEAAAPATRALEGAGTKEGLVDVPSPMLGTFYVAPEPGKEPFVTVGARVEADTVVGIVEAMKLLTRVHAGVAGEVAEVLASNDTLVEFGQPLFRIRPA